MTSSSTSTSYISIRDDAKSLSLNEREFLRAGALGKDASKVLRVDGRGPGDLRKLKLHLSRRHNGAECTVQWGETRVSAEINASLQPPSSEDRPAEGIVSISVDASPMASTSFGMMPPLTTTPGDANRPNFQSNADDSQKLLGNRILRALERTILLGGALDTEALCVQSGAWVWKLALSVRILDHGGNLLDAAVLAAMATLRHYRKPQVTVVETGMPLLIPSESREPTPLPLHHTPLTMSFALIHADDVALSTSSTLTVAALVDPTEREEMVQTGSISLAMNLHSEVCLLDFGGGCELQPSQLKQCWRLAEKCIKQLCQLLETSLEAADEKAQNEALRRLQHQQHQENPNLPPLPAGGEPQVPFWHQDDDMQVDTATPFTDTVAEVKSAAEIVKDQEQEAYRRQALEYNQGHVAAKVKDDKGKKKSKKQEGGTLLAAMLKSAKQVGDVDNPRFETNGTDDMQVNAILTTESGVSSSEQKDEFAQFAKAAKAESKKPTAVDMVSDDEEEESPTILKTEFESVKAATSAGKGKKPDATTNEDDVHDLAMAIKSKKKKKTKKGKGIAQNN